MISLGAGGVFFEYSIGPFNRLYTELVELTGDYMYFLLNSPCDVREIKRVLVSFVFVYDAKPFNRLFVARFVDIAGSCMHFL